MNRKLHTLLLAAVVMVSPVHAQNGDAEPPTSSAMNHLYPTPERWSGSRYTATDPSFGERLYFIVGGGAYQQWGKSGSLNAENWGVSGQFALGYNLSPVHSIELGASIGHPLQDGFNGNFTELGASYLFNVTAYAHKSEVPTAWELYLKAGTQSAFTEDQYALNFSGAVRLKYNVSPTFGVYVEPSIALTGYSRSNSTHSPYVGGDITPSISLGFSIRPSAIVNSIEGIVDRRNERLNMNGYDVKPLFALKTNLLYDAVSVINFGLEVPIKSRYSVDIDLLCPWWVWDDGTKDSERSRLMLVNGNIEGKYWFGDRDQRDVLTGWYAGLYVGGGLYDFEREGKGIQGEFLLLGGVSGGYAHTINKAKTLRLEYSLGFAYLESDYKKYEALYSSDNAWHAVESSNGVYQWFGPAKAEVSLSWLLRYKKMKGGRR